MSILKPSTTLRRIEIATKKSPIIVLRATNPGYLESYFGGTVYGRQVIASGHPRMVGVFDNTMNLKAVAVQLSAAAGKG